MMVLPIRGRRRIGAGALDQPDWAIQLAAGITALWAAAITVLMQSRSIWLSAVIVFWLWMRT